MPSHPPVVGFGTAGRVTTHFSQQVCSDDFSQDFFSSSHPALIANMMITPLSASLPLVFVFPLFFVVFTFIEVSHESNNNDSKNTRINDNSTSCHVASDSS